MKTLHWKLTVWIFSTLIVGNAVAAAQQPDDVANKFEVLSQNVSSAAEWQAWGEFIKPFESDLKWKQTPWLSTFQEGITKAAEVDKPVLLWTMNGHPLGCT